MRKAVILAVTGVVAVVLASAAQAGVVQVGGVQSPQHADGSYSMSGSLIGTWWPVSFELKGLEPSGGIQGSGTELFIGCLDVNGNGACDGADLSGTIGFAFTVSAKYDPTFTTELHGRCHHPVTGGTGDFAGVAGVLDYKDDPVTGCAYYRGHLDLP